MKRYDPKLICGLAILACGLGLHMYYFYGFGEGPHDMVEAMREAIERIVLLGMVPGPAPYILCAILLPLSQARAIALGGLAGTLAGDLLAFFSVFVIPGSSTAPIILIFMPRINLLVLMPLGMAIALAIILVRRCRRAGETDPSGG